MAPERTVSMGSGRGAYGEKTGKAMKKCKFKAKIEAGDGGGAYVLFPYDAGKEFATRAILLTSLFGKITRQESSKCLHNLKT